MTTNAHYRLIKDGDAATYCNATGHIRIVPTPNADHDIRGGVCDCADREDYWAARNDRA